MIKIVNLTKSYKNEDNVIDNINLEIKDGEIFGFIGQNGAGKTTTIKMITGILQIDNGDIFIDGKSITKESLKVNMSKLKKYIHNDKKCNFLIYHDKDRYRFVRYKI